jgi:ATP-dependent Clp protease ATP-binding subunit ClpA
MIRLGHSEIRPEHLLLGVLREGAGPAGRVLTQLEVDKAELGVAVESALEPGSPHNLAPETVAALDRLPNLTRESGAIAEGIIDELERSPEGLSMLLKEKRIPESLRELWRRTDAVNREVKKCREVIEQDAVVRQFTLSADAELVLDEATNAAAELGHTWVGSEHLLLGLTRVEATPAAESLQRSGVNADSALRELLKVIKEES